MLSKKEKILGTKIAAVLLLIVIAAGMHYMDWVDDTHKKMMMSEAAALIQSDPSVIILDVRRQDEYDKKHIPNAVLLPIEDINVGSDKIELTLPDKDRTILVYCQTGRRAELASSKLAKRGYKHVYDIGGLVEWTGPTEGEE